MMVTIKCPECSPKRPGHIEWIVTRRHSMRNKGDSEQSLCKWRLTLLPAVTVYKVISAEIASLFCESCAEQGRESNSDEKTHSDSTSLGQNKLSLYKEKKVTYFEIEDDVLLKGHSH